MPDATSRSGLLTRGRKAALLVFMLVVAIAAGSMTCRSAGQRAPTLTKDGVAALQRGMNEDALVETLGPPLSSAWLSGDADPRKVLTYASPPTWHLGERYLWTGSGVRFVVTLRDGALDSAHIAGTALGPASRLCVCTREACSVDWAESCLDLFAD